MSFVSVRVLHKKQPSDRTVDSSVGPPCPPTSKLFLSGCPHRPSEKTAIHVRYFSQGGSYDGYNLGYNPCYNLYNLGYNRDKHLISSIPGDRCYKNLWNLC